VTIAASVLVAAAFLVQAPAGALPTGAPKNGMVCTAGTVSGATHTFDLTTGTGDIQTPDGNTVFMWSYADTADPKAALRTFQYPGPNLCVTEGETVTVNLKNTLPEPSSIVFPAQDAPVNATGGSAGLLTREAAANGGTVSYSFVASHPGTYLYESGTDIDKQIEMGLYGALIVRPAGHADWAYNGATAFDPAREYLMLLAEIDPELHHAVENGLDFDFTTKHDRYFTINGRSFPDTIQQNGSTLLPYQPYGALVRLEPTVPGQPPALIRMINAGSDNHPFHPHGNHTTQIAQDGRLVAPTEHFGETIGAGMTEDFTLRWDNTVNGDDWNPATNPLPTQPNYRNLTFKDGNTWYSGSPYLGYSGTLPTGTVSQNICGEWYFPFHSHALNEFTNFDEGFGGMGTLLRVDPRGGCFVGPSASKITTGTLNGGSFSALAADDTAYYRVNSAGNPQTTDWYGQFSGVPAGATGLKVTYKGNTTFSPYTQNFNSLGTGNNNTSLPAGWAFSESGTGANTSYGSGTGSSSTANTYSFGSNNSSERAFGTLHGSGTNTFSSMIGAAFTNSTGGTISSLTVNYTGEQWRYGGGAGPDKLDFQFSTNATSLTTGTWTDVDNLDFSSPVTSGTTGGRNGNQAANRTAKSFTITGLNIAPGATYRIRWTDFDLGGSSVADDGLGIDDLSITPDAALPTTVSVCIWTTNTSCSWSSIAGPTNVGAADVLVADNVAIPAGAIGKGTNKGVVRVRVVTTGATAPFVTGGNYMRLVYTAP